jgi:hypothetical protein
VKLDRAEVVPIDVVADETDVDAFAPLAYWGIGIPVREGPRETAARYAPGHAGEVRNCSTQWRRGCPAGPREAGR